jgi:hypothetical protein
MEKRILDKLTTQTTDYKQQLVTEVMRLKNGEITTTNLIEFIYASKPTDITKMDFIKRKRAKNCVPMDDRCEARRAKGSGHEGDQCTRRKKKGCTYCGTHSKGVPHGIIINHEPSLKKKMIWAEEIRGIVYWLDEDHNVYNTEDIMKNIPNPTFIGSWTKVGISYELILK